MRRLPLLLLPLLLLAACDEEVALILPMGADVRFQNPPTAVDILLVVDNSCSMADEQQKLSQGFDAFVEFFDVADVDYQIGVTTTDMQSTSARGRLVGAAGERIIRRETPDASAVFRDHVNVGIEGSPVERGLDAAEAALTDQIDGPNAGFLRDEALLSIIFVSDEEDASFPPVNTMINRYRDIKGQRQRDSFNASVLAGIDPVTGEPADCGDRTPDNPNIGASMGERYHDVAVQTGGVAASICADEFNDIVSRMGLASSRLKDRFDLSSDPQEDTVEVFAYLAGDPETEVPLPAAGLPADGTTPEISPWVVEADADGVFWIRFTDIAHLPPLDTRLVINYRFA